MLPPPLAALEPLAYDLWWSWDSEATALWASVDPWRWDRCRQNPVALLQDVEPSRWEALAQDADFLDRLARVAAAREAYRAEKGWCAEAAPELGQAGGVAYLSMEFGLHPSLRIYSGGLGVLAGDHLKSASDLGVPLVGVGLLYRRGYFRQVIDDGRQVAAYPSAEYARLPVRLCRDDRGEPLLVEVPVAHHTLQAKVWLVEVGRVRLYLLDSDHALNNERDRDLTRALYGGDAETRIRQEVLLGVGGVRALRAVGESPAVFHLNEGHCAFALLELAREQMAEHRIPFSAAFQRVRERCVFTTHTPVPAGHDRFAWDLVDKVLGPWRKAQHLPPGSYMDISRVRPGDWNEPLCMTVLALRGCAKANGVSKLHGEVSRDMWHPMWPDRAVEDVPIGHVTNGVHPLYWMAPEARALFDEHVPGWRERCWSADVWAAAAQIPDEALWRVREALRARLRELVAQRAGALVDPDALIIGFARRFAPYKRGDLLFHDGARLQAILEKGPVHVIFSGKAHPRDENGQRIVAEVVRQASAGRFRHRVTFVEDYDMVVGALLTAGADVWLNNPRRPQEASGTSGQKVLLNGGLNLSVLDGWWDEGYDGTNGWAIGKPAPAADIVAQDAADAASLYDLLEQEIIPTWQDRSPQGTPTRWLDKVRRSIMTGVPAFNSHRMVRDYVLELYAPQARSSRG